MTVLQAVFGAITCAVLLGCALIVAGVAVLFGAGWALVAAGSLIVASAAVLGVVLLREPSKETA
jgi:hypothetical protein